MSAHPQGRLRERPSRRFAAEERRFNLEDVARKLKSEDSASTQGHRQIALYRHGPTTVALFLFERGRGLHEHRAEGFVTIHCVAGHLSVTTPAAAHDLPAGTLLTLAPNVPHDVNALEESRMLLTVALETRDDGADS
jgi:quercetin dioxygenase-like cupin family protein